MTFPPCQCTKSSLIQLFSLLCWTQRRNSRYVCVYQVKIMTAAPHCNHVSYQTFGTVAAFTLYHCTLASHQQHQWEGNLSQGAIDMNLHNVIIKISCFYANNWHRISHWYLQFMAMKLNAWQLLLSNVDEFPVNFSRKVEGGLFGRRELIWPVKLLRRRVTHAAIND